jgi:hypothetical protein
MAVVSSTDEEAPLYRELLRDARFYEFELKVDRERLAEARAEGCGSCGGALHAAHFHRKPRGGLAGLGEDHDKRFSLCCDREGCRGRCTPPSLRFLGRKVYLSTVVVVVSAMRHGATSERMRKVQEHFGVSRRTVERWRVWWRDAFAEGPFWRVASAAFMPPVRASLLPASLLARFSGDEEARLVGLLRFLGPITGGARAR